MRPKALRKRDEVAGSEAEAEDGWESEAEGVPLTIISITLYISSCPQEDPYPFLFGSPARYVSCLD